MPTSTGVTVVAHRGLAPGLPENTLAAFRGAIARRADAIEIDLGVTGILTNLPDLLRDIVR